MKAMKSNQVRQVDASMLSLLPSVDAVLSSFKGERLCRRYPRWLAKEEVVNQLAEVRRRLLAGEGAHFRSREAVARLVLREAESAARRSGA